MNCITEEGIRRTEFVLFLHYDDSNDYGYGGSFVLRTIMLISNSASSRRQSIWELVRLSALVTPMIHTVEGLSWPMLLKK
jgi:hypothetical protein